MICPRCHAENLSGTRFCGQCGAPLSSICGSCGASNPAENKFCGQCGTSIVSGNLASIGTVGNATGSSPPYRRVQTGHRPVSGDIVNSTGLAERIGAEPLHELLRRFLDTGIAEVRRFGGTVPQFTGDGFMALFGAPIAHEDHVRRALLAAVAIQTRRCRQCGSSRRSRGGYADPHRPQYRPRGLGPVADKLRMDSTAIGDAANIAARLQEAAEPGTSSSARQPSGWRAGISSPSRSEP